jgi:hypothetical protein
LAHMCGYGYLFFSVCPHMVQTGGRFKMLHIDGAYYSKAYGAINHFETTQ